ncbi:hypothetical protein T01_4457 [Trichinella spiralis]|uniref:Uncharacterized protein n=1 Tax=Trichinella spiralis TaxID=6334 RepID=A0A0V1BHR7_TRISP|nr:hypothetical protein T01_4457 [Trichinella spiralis]
MPQMQRGEPDLILWVAGKFLIKSVDYTNCCLMEKIHTESRKSLKKIDLLLLIECDSSFIGQITAFSLKEKKFNVQFLCSRESKRGQRTLCKLILSGNCFTNINYGVSFSDIRTQKKTQLPIKALSSPTIDIKCTIDSVELNLHPELFLADRVKDSFERWDNDSFIGQDWNKKKTKKKKKKIGIVSGSMFASMWWRFVRHSEPNWSSGAV